MTAHIGTSGFAYLDWKPRFFPQDVPQAKLLQHYSTRLPSVEINYTFQRFPTEKLLSGWAAKVPDGFTFSLKAPRRISHGRRLRECADDMERFVAPARTLGSKLGVLLVQLPPTMVCDAGLLKEFVRTLPHDLRVAMEFRHQSWLCDETFEVLGNASVAFVGAESDDAAATLHSTAPFSYLRLRRSSYDDALLDEWSARIVRDADVYCYLRHDSDGSNALAAEKLRGRLESAREESL